MYSGSARNILKNPALRRLGRFASLTNYGHECHPQNRNIIVSRECGTSSDMFVCCQHARHNFFCMRQNCHAISVYGYDWSIVRIKYCPFCTQLVVLTHQPVIPIHWKLNEVFCLTQKKHCAVHVGL